MIFEIRNLLEQEIQKSLRSTGEIDTYNLVKNFAARRKDAVENASEELIALGLRTLVSEIRKRKKHKLWSDEQRLLFEGLPGLRQSIPIKSASGRRVTKSLPSLKIGELEEWLHSDSQPQSRVQSNPELAALFNQIMPFALDMDTTVEEAYRAFKSGRKPKKSTG